MDTEQFVTVLGIGTVIFSFTLIILCSSALERRAKKNRR